MSYYVKFNDITSMQGQTNQTIQQWGESLKNLQKSIALLANQSELQGKAMTSAKSYMTEVHGTFIQTLTLLMNEYIASFLLYRDGYYQIDTHNHAGLPEDVYKGLYSDLGKSKQRFEQQLEQLTTAKLRVAGLVNYQGTSHTKTKFTYEKLMKDIKHLDESITQYEEMHARQDLQAFKELLAATKSLLAEHSSRDRSLGSYQSGAFGKLPSVQRFMVAYEQVTAQLNGRMGIIQAALERDQVRMEALHAEERGKQGVMNLVFSVLTMVAGATALVISGGTMWPIVTSAFKYGAMAMFMYGASNSIEAGQNIYYGLSGDGKSFAMNPIRDTLFLGNGELYHSLGQIFSLTTGVFIPIAQTQSIAQGISQFFWGTVGSIATGQAAYHGTKLLGGNEETAQLMNLIGNFIGGYSAAKAVENFSLNGKTVPKVKSALEIENRVMENIKASKTAREHSNFKEFALNEKYQQIMNDFRPENLARKQLIEKYRSWGISPTDSVQILEISENAPKIKYIKDSYTEQQILGIEPDPDKGIFRPDVEDYLTENYIKVHIQQFKKGVSRFQIYKPNETWQNGIVGGEDGTSFWISKKNADILEKVANGDNRLFEKLLGFDEGYLGDGPIYRLDVSPEVVAQKGVYMSTGNEYGANKWWRPGGRTYPGGIPEVIMRDISTARGEHTWKEIN